jgi:hypothetical protein
MNGIATDSAPRSRRQRVRVVLPLRLTELPAAEVIDSGADTDAPVELVSFGLVREICPKCETTHLSLILRQKTVRREHLFCAHCGSCFSAQYPDGTCALSL